MRLVGQNAKVTRVEAVFVVGFVYFVIFVFGKGGGGQLRSSEGGALPTTMDAMELKANG